jgi:sarcosine oxidase subunit gamma
MVEGLTRTDPLDAKRLTAGQHGSAQLQIEPAAAQFSFRGPSSTAIVAGRAFGVKLPLEPCRAQWQNSRAALWLGPDEWLLLGPADQANDIRTALAAWLHDIPHALVAIGHRNAALRISGPASAAVLNAGCPLDLHETAFPVGMCTRTLLAKAPVILWRTGQQHFYLSAWRSFMPYIWDYLVEARTRL